MYYESTRNNKLKKKFSEVLLEGLAGDGGLYVPPEEGECCSVCVEFALPGDLNADGQINVIDIVMAVDLILNNNYNAVGDINGDGVLNVIDIVIIVDMVLNP